MERILITINIKIFQVIQKSYISYKSYNYTKELPVNC